MPLSKRDASVVSQMTRVTIAEESGKRLDEFQRIIAAIPPEAGFGGVWESEMFLFYAAVKPLRPKQILESGRARGKSTSILAHCFSEARILSIELDRDTENAAAAEAKLKSFSNIQLLYGDSRRLMKQHLGEGDAVLIDGPKDFRALKLALDLLVTGKPCAVFVHDFPPGSPVRKFVEKNWPEVFFGDDPAFASFRQLDQARDPRTSAHRRGYGIFACFPGELRISWWQTIKLVVAGLFRH